MSIIKAVIDIEDGAGIGPLNKIVCMFNPTELTISKGAEWKKTPTAGTGEKKTTFVTATPGKFDLNLVFDTTEDGSPVTSYTDLLLRLIEPNKNLPKAVRENKRPPFVWFSWGRWRSFKAYVTSVSLTFTYFSIDGVPLRAKAKVGFEQPDEDEKWPRQNPTSHTPAPHRVHRIGRGETLDRIASTYYGDASDWRRIAVANGISDPLRLQVGSMLSIPKQVDAGG